MKKKDNIRITRLNKVYNIIKHDDKLQSMIIVLCCFGSIAIITLLCLIFN